MGKERAGWLVLGAWWAGIVGRAGGAASLAGSGGVVEAGVGVGSPRHTLTRRGPRQAAQAAPTAIEWMSSSESRPPAPADPKT